MIVGGGGGVGIADCAAIGRKKGGLDNEREAGPVFSEPTRPDIA